MPGARLWEDSTPREIAHSYCLPLALSNTPPPLLCVLWGFRAPSACVGQGGGAQVQSTSWGNRLFYNISMWASLKRGVQVVPVEFPVQECGWQWQQNMHCQCKLKHLGHQVSERVVQWDRGPDELISLGEGERAFGEKKTKSRKTLIAKGTEGQENVRHVP